MIRNFYPTIEFKQTELFVKACVVDIKVKTDLRGVKHLRLINEDNDCLGNINDLTVNHFKEYPLKVVLMCK